VLVIAEENSHPSYSYYLILKVYIATYFR